MEKKGLDVPVQASKQKKKWGVNFSFLFLVFCSGAQWVGWWSHTLGRAINFTESSVQMLISPGSSLIDTPKIRSNLAPHGPSSQYTELTITPSLSHIKVTDSSWFPWDFPDCQTASLVSWEALQYLAPYCLD